MRFDRKKGGTSLNELHDVNGANALQFTLMRFHFKKKIFSVRPVLVSLILWAGKSMSL